MAIFKKILFFLLLIFGCLWAEEIPQDLQEFVDNFLEVSSFRAKLEQTNFVKMMDEKEVYKGNILFDKNKLLIKYSFPSLQLVYSDKRETVVYLQESNQKIISPPTLIFWPNKMISKFLLGGRDFVRKGSGVEFSYQFVPDLEQSENVAKVELGVREGLISFIKYYDLEGNFTKYEFFDLHLGVEIDPSSFRIAYPKDAEVIDNR